MPYFEKPPLLYWLTAISFKLFGISEISARAVSGSAAVLCCCALWQWAQWGGGAEKREDLSSHTREKRVVAHHFGGAAHHASGGISLQLLPHVALLLLASSIGFFVMARTLMTDMLLAATFTWTLAFFWRWLQTPKTVFYVRLMPCSL